MKTILETLKELGSFQTLLTTLTEADLAQKLDAPGPLTLFAPDDHSFERMNLEEISRDRESLSSLLKYHMVSGRVSASDIGRSDSLYTECGKSLTVRLAEGKAVIDNGNLVKTDIECSNGVIHVVDNVFLPQFSGWYCGCC